MAHCTCCGKWAGFFRDAHPQCAQFEAEVIATITRFAKAPYFPTLQSELATLRANAPMTFAQQQQSVLEGWKSVAEEMLSDGYLDEAEQAKLEAIAQACDLDVESLRETNMFWRMAKAATLRQVLHGLIPEHSIEGMPFTLNLQRGEKVVWVFEDAAFLEDRTYRQRANSPLGVGVRIASGLYYRTGGSAPVDVETRVHVDDGTLVVTDRHLHFVGTSRSIRISYAKVISFQEYSDGIGVTKDGVSAKQQAFLVGDGWFVYNLATNLMAIAAQ